MLKELDREANNVVRLEDPIEYNIEGVNQSQVRPEIGYDFASGLRTILRQDPDIIMVGENKRQRNSRHVAIQRLDRTSGFIHLAYQQRRRSCSEIDRHGVDPYF